MGVVGVAEEESRNCHRRRSPSRPPPLRCLVEVARFLTRTECWEFAVATALSAAWPSTHADLLCIDRLLQQRLVASEGVVEAEEKVR